ncbi:putative ankyrin repeat protein RF_0381 [Leptopilina heterotoma]|uniref:putative ankyrin repeat protein RF_0381 n=1 Tax=Leptopilina heterotoma TaxID=63436 RepID=UPI001CA9D7CC|nr:putative ankyrin repeat protein RF_0381 [Leptopilina heterotoma]
MDNQDIMNNEDKKFSYEKEDILSAVRENNYENLKEIFSYFKNEQNLAAVINCHHEHEDCILLLALRTRDVKILDLFLNKGLCDVNEKIQDLLLHEAIKINEIGILNKLIENGCVNNQSICEHKLPPLFELIEQGRLEWIRRFYEVGVSFQQRTKNHLPLLHFAFKIQGTTKELLKLLIAYGAELSIKDPITDLTPLHYLISEKVLKSNRQKVKFIKILLKFGADPNCYTKIKDEYVLYTALRMENHFAVRLLLIHGANINSFGIISEEVVNYSQRPNLTKTTNLIRNLFYLHRELFTSLYIEQKKIDQRLLKLRNILNVDVMLDQLAHCGTIYGINPQAIVTANENKLTAMMRNEEMWTILVLHMYRYPTWYWILKFLVKKGKERQILLDKCGEPFTRAMKGRLNYYVVTEILNYLGRTDLRSLLAACCPESCMERLVPKLYRLAYSDSEIFKAVQSMGIPNIRGILC